jgi:hypothetical protein
MEATFTYYCTNYAAAVLSLQTAGNKLIYVGHYKEEIDGDESLACSDECIWSIHDMRLHASTLDAQNLTSAPVPSVSNNPHP